MPIEKCTVNGKSGFRYGKSGKCYTGPGAGKKAAKQGIAEDGEAKFKQEMSKGVSISNDEVETAIAELIEFGPEPKETGDRFLDGAQAYVSQKTRDAMSKDDFGWPEERKYPVKDQKHLDSAVKLLGRAPADKQAAIKERLKKIAKRRGLSLPKDWS